MANRGQWRTQTQTTKPKNKKNKKKDQKKTSNFGKKGKQQKKIESAKKTGASATKKTGNSRADERREGATRARQNPVNKARGGAQNYIVKDKVQPIVTAPTKVVSGTLKNAQDTAGLNRHRSGATTQTKRNDRLTSKQQATSVKAVKEEQNRLKKIEANKAEHKKNGYAYGNNAIKTLDKYNKKVDKAFNEGKEKDLEYGASAFSNKKMDIPLYTKYAKSKAEAEAKAALKESGVTQKQGKENVYNWIDETESKWKKDGKSISDDTVVTEDGKTWGQIKQEAYDQEAARIRAQRSMYINKTTNGAGQLSAQDIYKGGVEMASEFIDYGVPYMATAKGSIKVAEKLMAKAAKAGKAGKAGAKTVPKIEKAVDDLVKEGKLTPQAAEKLNKKIALKSGAKSVSKELIANALQDATIGTAIDLGKGIEQGLQGKDLEKYMKDNAIANLVLGVPMSGIAGRAGAKEAKAAMSMDYAKAINDATNLTKPEAIKLENLLKKQEKGTITGAESNTLKTLQDKALGEGSAVVNSKGKLEVNKTDFAVDDLTKAEATEYFKLKAQTERGNIDPRDVPRFNELRGKVESAYRAAEAKAETTINVANRKITSAMQENAESAVRFYERTGDKAKLKQAQDVLERAKVATQKKNLALEENINKMKDITKGEYRWVDANEMEALSGDRYNGGFFDPATGEIVVNRDSPQAFQTIIGHETMHMMKAANREGYDKLANMLTDYVKELGEYDSLLAEAKRAYHEDALLASRGDVDAQARLDEEVVSEMLGRYVFGEDDTFIKKLAGEDPTTLQKIIAYIKQLFGNTQNKELAEQLDKLQKTALDEIHKVKEADWKERGLVEVTGKEKQEIIKKSQFAPVSEEDGMYSYAWEVANKLGKSVKSDAHSLERYFMKKGVSKEEMEWTGLRDFLYENSPVSKDAMLNFLENNNYELWTVARASTDYRNEAWKRYRDDSKKVLQKWLKDEKDTLEELIDRKVHVTGVSRERVEQYVLDNPIEELSRAGINPADVYESLGGKPFDDYNTLDSKWDNYALKGGKNYREYEYVDPRMTGYSNQAMNVHWSGDKDVVVHSRVQDFHESTGRLTSASQNIAKETSRAAQELAQAVEIGDKIDIKIGEHEFHGEPRFNEEKYRIVHVDDVGEIADIKEFSYGQNFSDDFFRDLLYTEPEAYVNGGKVLHIEEIQSDWHNAGQTKGYKSEASSAKIAERNAEIDTKLQALEKEYNKTEKEYNQAFVKSQVEGGRVRSQEMRDAREKLRDINRQMTELEHEQDELARVSAEQVPNAPYKNNYTDYAMKRALREAVENDYDIISWTTAKQQAERWSDEYMKGYEIEYDQDIPSFMKKYGAQWGAEVEKIRLAENGEEVWAMRITDEMRDSIKAHGQRRWSKFGIEGAQGEQKAKGIQAEQMFKDGKTPEEIWNKTGVIVDTDGKAKWEFSDKDMKFKFKMKDLRGEGRIEDGRLEDLLEHKELFDRYPQLKDVIVEFGSKRDLDGAEGEYINLGDFKMIRLARGQSKEDMMDSLIHEVQHAIQEEEGFAGGASPEYYRNVIINLEKSTNDFEARYPDYHIEQEADGVYKVYNAEDRIVELDDEGVWNLDKYDNAEPIFTYDSKNDEVTVNNESAMQNVDTSLVDGFKNYAEESNALFNLYRTWSEDSTTGAVRIEDAAYYHTKGEWEAEETASRREFTQEELDRTPRFENDVEIMREDFDKYYGNRGKKASKFAKETEKRDLDLRGNLEKADELIKEKRFGYEEAEELTKKIREIDEQVAELDAKKKTTARVHKIDSLEAERKKLNTRLSNVIENSKSVVPEGKTAKETFNEVVGGNTLKAKGEGKMLNKFSVRKLLDENDGSKWGATKDLGRAFRRKTESSLIEYESTGKQLIKDGHKELGQALLDQANNVTVYKNKAAAAVESARASADGTKIGKSLNDVFKVEDKNGKIVDLLLEENAEMRQDLSNYLFCKHSFAREEQGKKVFGVIDEDGKPKWTNASTEQYMKEIEKEYGKKTVKAFEREIRDFIDYLNEYRLDTGLMSKELLDKLNDIYPYYIPTNRAVVNKPPKEYELPKNVAEVENGIKRAVGGDAPLEDLYTQLVKMTMATIRSGEQNKLLAMYAKAHNIEPTRLPKDTTADDVLESSVEAFDSDHRGNYKIRFYDNGEAVTIPVNKHAAKGIREFNGQDYATLIEVSAKLGRVLHMREYKGLITDWNLVFGVRNGMRDAQQALVNSKDSRYFTASIPRARAAVANENNAFRVLYDANGGRYSTLQQINRLDEIGALNKKGGTVAKGLEKIEDINGAIEMMPRMCEFIGTIQKEADNILGSKGIKELKREIEAEAAIKPEAERTAWIENEYAQRIVDLIKKEKPDIIATAIRNSADVTVNFSRSGVVTKAFNAGFVPYLNPSVQGLSKMMRMFTESKAQGFGKLACFGAKLSVLTIAPAMLNEILCKDNEAYQSINSRDKDNAFFIPMSLFGGEPDKFIKIPKPRENAVLAEPFEYGLRYFMDKAQYGTLDEFKQMFLSAEANVGIVNVWEDNIASPILNTMMNKTWYGGDILSKQELKNVENDEAWKNFDETTSWFAKKMGKLANISPKKVDNIMDSYMGLIYDFGISQTSQKNINDVYSSPKNFLRNNPFVQQFTKDAVFSNKYATKFWDKADELNKGHKGDKDTIEYREYMAKYGYDTFTYDSAISNIDNDKNIPKEEKVEMKRELRKYKNQLLRRALNGEDVKYDPMQRIINLYKAHGIKNATDVCLSTYAEGDHADAYKHLKQSKQYRDATPAEQRELQRKFLKTYKDVKKIARFTGDSDNFVNYSTVEYVCVKNGYTGGLIANMYAWKSKEYSVKKGLEDMKKYIDAGYTDKNFKVTMRAMNRGADALGDPDKQYASQLDDYDKAMICAKNGYRDGAYLIASPYIGKARMNAGRCLVEGHSGEDFKWTDKRINKFCKKYDISADKNHKWDLEQVADAVRKEYGDKTPEEQAAVYTVITGDTENNPFGEIGNYSHANDSGLLDDEKKKGKGGRGGGRRRRGGRGGGGSKGSTYTPQLASGTKPAKQTITAQRYNAPSAPAVTGKSQTVTKGHISNPFSSSDFTTESTLNDAYRKRVKKLRESRRK